MLTHRAAAGGVSIAGLESLTEPLGQSGLNKDQFGYPVADDASRNSKTRGVCNHFVPGGGEGWRLEAGGWKLEAGGWKLEARGWSVYVCGFGS
jgi:hypothetical protein